jgi:predicted RNA binding protein YcfA (HicA-like mRNA interferase family)
LARLKPLAFREVVRRLRAAGFAEVSQRGSHIKFAKVTAGEIRTAIVLRHAEIMVGTLRSILNQAGISPEEFQAI